MPSFKPSWELSFYSIASKFSFKNLEKWGKAMILSTTPRHCTLMAESVLWLSQSDYKICIEYTSRSLLRGAGMAQWWLRLPPTNVASVQILKTLCRKWVEFVVGSCPCSEGFPPGSLVFLHPQKSTFLNSNLIRNLRATGLSVVWLLCSTLVKTKLIFLNFI